MRAQLDERHVYPLARWTVSIPKMQQQDTNVVTTLLPFGLNRSLTLVSQRHVLSNTTTNANRTQRLPNSTKSVATRGHVRRTQKQSTNLATSLLAFGNSKTPTLENSND
nr:hypothetical protein [Tanacetum cinerariifolium]